MATADESASIWKKSTPSLYAVLDEHPLGIALNELIGGAPQWWLVTSSVGSSCPRSAMDSWRMVPNHSRWMYTVRSNDEAYGHIHETPSSSSVARRMRARPGFCEHLVRSPPQRDRKSMPILLMRLRLDRWSVWNRKRSSSGRLPVRCFQKSTNRRISSA